MSKYLFQPFFLTERRGVSPKTVASTTQLKPFRRRRRGSGTPVSAAWEAEAHRVMGDLLLQRSPGALNGAEDSYRRAIDQSRQQNAKSLELRATTSLARLWRDQNKRTEGRDLLAPVYGWFTEGFDTPDLREAKALLIELHK